MTEKKAAAKGKGKAKSNAKKAGTVKKETMLKRPAASDSVKTKRPQG